MQSQLQVLELSRRRSAHKTPTYSQQEQLVAVSSSGNNKQIQHAVA
jgi:hypothetical protein